MTAPDPFTIPEYDRAALVTIDVQNDTLDGGTFEVPGTSTILPRIINCAGPSAWPAGPSSM